MPALAFSIHLSSILQISSILDPSIPPIEDEDDDEYEQDWDDENEGTRTRTRKMSESGE
jgi:hypothetical protein